MDYYTNTWDLARAIKETLLSYRSNDASLQFSKKPDINWGLGFVMPQAILPAITVFPVDKTFKPARGGGVSIVEYSYTIDIYQKNANLALAKEYCLLAVEDVRNCISNSPFIMDSSGKKHCFATRVIAIEISESINESDRSFTCTARVRIVCTAYHVKASKEQEIKELKTCDISSFINVASDAIRGDVSKLSYKKWQTMISVPITTSPTIFVLPGNEIMDDVFTSADLHTRPIEITIVTNDYPKAENLKKNIDIADEIVSAVEMNYRLNGYAENYRIDSISYNWRADSAFEFVSAVSVSYELTRKRDRISV